MKVYIVGAGPGNPDQLTGEARRIIAEADRVVSTPRLATQLGSLNSRIEVAETGLLEEAVLAARGRCERVAVLVSGDPGFFSAAGRLKERLERAGAETRCLCGLSSLQYLCARVGLRYDRMKSISLHGRTGSLVPHVCYNREVFALTGGEIKAHTAVAELVEAGLGDVQVWIGENLGSGEKGAAERIVAGTARELLAERFVDLACLIVRNDRCADCCESVPDEAFIRGDAPMTKRSVRALALALLNIRPEDTVLDIGAGTGAVTVETARRAHAGRVFAVERNAAALELLRRNRERFGAFNITVVPGIAPEALQGLPAADKVFVGGSGGNLDAIVRAVFARNPEAGMVITAVTLETLHEAVSVLSALGWEPDVTCLNAATAHRLGAYHLMKAENPVHIVKAGRPGRSGHEQ